MAIGIIPNGIFRDTKYLWVIERFSRYPIPELGCTKLRYLFPIFFTHKKDYDISEPPKMWGDSIIGYGSYHYKTGAGREGDWYITGFSPRKQSLTVYIMAGFERYETLMQQLGKYKLGKSCLYIKKLEDVDEEILKQLIQEAFTHMNAQYNQV